MLSSCSLKEVVKCVRKKISISLLKNISIPSWNTDTGLSIVIDVAVHFRYLYSLLFSVSATTLVET